MQINYHINIHLDRREPSPILDCVQGESGRAVTVSLYEKDQPWVIPEDAAVLVRYGRPDTCGGVYDTLPDGTKACTVSGNAITAVLTPQSLAVAGLVSFQLAVIAQGSELATFIFLVRVESDPSIQTTAGENYICLLPELMQAAMDAMDAAGRAEASARQAQMAAIRSNATIPLSFSLGTINRETGVYIANTSSNVTDFFPVIDNRVNVTIPSYLGGTLHYYDENLGHLGYYEVLYGASYHTPGYYERLMPNSAKFARLVVQQLPIGAVDDTSPIRAYVVDNGNLRLLRSITVGDTAASDFTFYTDENSNAIRVQRLVIQATLPAAAQAAAGYLSINGIQYPNILGLSTQARQQRICAQVINGRMDLSYLEGGLGATDACDQQRHYLGAPVSSIGFVQFGLSSDAVSYPAGTTIHILGG